jgi:hypothetical protein
MAIMKKIALAGFATAAGIVLFRFGLIVVRVLRGEFAAKPVKTQPK